MAMCSPNLISFPSWHLARMHFPVSHIIRTHHVTEFWTMECIWKEIKYAISGWAHKILSFSPSLFLFLYAWVIKMTMRIQMRKACIPDDCMEQSPPTSPYLAVWYEWEINFHYIKPLKCVIVFSAGDLPLYSLTKL